MHRDARGGGTHTLHKDARGGQTPLTWDGSEMHARGGGTQTLTPVVASGYLPAPQSTHTVGGGRAHSCNRAATELQQSCELQHNLSQPQQSASRSTGVVASIAPRAHSCNRAATELQQSCELQLVASIASDRASRCCDFQRSDEADELQQRCNRAATDEPSDRAYRCCDLQRSDLLAQCLQEDGVDPCFKIEKRLAEHEADAPSPLQQSCKRPVNGNRQVQLPPHVRDRIFQLMILHCRYPSGTHLTCFTRLGGYLHRPYLVQMLPASTQCLASRPPCTGSASFDSSVRFSDPFFGSPCSSSGPQLQYSICEFDKPSPSQSFKHATMALPSLQPT